MVSPVHSGSPLLGVETISCHKALERLFFVSGAIRNKKIQPFVSLSDVQSETDVFF